jgi:serine/threonine protein kinase
MTDEASLTSLQQQSAYKLDVDVRKGEKIFGAFGKIIYEAQWIDTHGSPIVLLEMTGEKAHKEAILNITLSHAHIIKTYGTVASNTRRISSNAILLLQEYAPDGDLAGRLSTRMFIPSQSVLAEIFIQVSTAMIYLSENGIIHGDLACRNVLVFKTNPFEPKLNLVKLIDFGLAQNSSTASDTEIDIPVRYAAPEIIRSNGRSGYSQESDVFSFGALMWEACSSGKIPYEDIDEDKAIRQQKLNGEKLQRPKDCDPNIWTLMVKCWSNKPEDRPSFQTIHTQLKNIQNTNLP